MSLSALNSSVSFMQQQLSSNAQNTQLAMQQVQSGSDARAAALDSTFQAKEKLDNQVLQVEKASPGRIDTWA